MSPKRNAKWKIIGPWYVRGGVRGKCVPQEICRYLDELGDWLQEHYERTLLDRLAICNLENIHYNPSGGSQTPVLCTGGGGDPPAEDPPPVWG